MSGSTTRWVFTELIDRDGDQAAVDRIEERIAHYRRTGHPKLQANNYARADWHGLPVLTCEVVE